jgi:preprotein translocase YajC subunit
MWLFVIRPQKRRQLQQQQLLENVSVGDEIITAGGLHGEVVSLGQEVLQIEIAPDVVVRLDRRAIAAVARDLDDEALEEDEELAELEEADPMLGDESARTGEDAKAR